MGGSLRAAALAAIGTNRDERLRVHAEWSEAGVRVWLGADRDGSVPLAQLTTLLLHQLRRWLGAHGVRLESLVCNGHMFFSHRHDQEVP